MRLTDYIEATIGTRSRSGRSGPQPFGARQDGSSCAARGCGPPPREPPKTLIGSIGEEGASPEPVQPIEYQRHDLAEDIERLGKPQQEGVAKRLALARAHGAAFSPASRVRDRQQRNGLRRSQREFGSMEGLAEQRDQPADSGPKPPS